MVIARLLLLRKSADTVRLKIFAPSLNLPPPPAPSRILTLIHSIFLTRILTARRGIAALLPASAKAFTATSTQLVILGIACGIGFLPATIPNERGIGRIWATARKYLQRSSVFTKSVYLHYISGTLEQGMKIIPYWAGGSDVQNARNYSDLEFAENVVVNTTVMSPQKITHMVGNLDIKYVIYSTSCRVY